jgi:hypothetical protein
MKMLSGHIADYDVLIVGNKVAVLNEEGLVTDVEVPSPESFAKIVASPKLMLGYAKVEDMEIIYIYDKAQDNFGYAINLDVDYFSEYGFSPFPLE